jgi:hypothetical protein
MLWIELLAIMGGPIAVIAAILAWRDRGLRRRGGHINYPTPNALDARRGGAGQPVTRGYPVVGTGVAEVFPPSDP